MAVYVSKKGTINAPATSLYMSFVDPRVVVKQVQDNMPADAPKEGRIIEVTYDFIRFEVKGIEMQIDVLGREPYSKLTYGADRPIKFTIEVHFDQIPDTFQTEFWIKADIEMNIFMAGILGGKVQKGLDALVDGLASGKMPNFQDMM